MPRIEVVESQSQLQQFVDFHHLSAAELNLLADNKANALLLCRDDGGKPVGCCGLWWHGTPQHDGFRTGSIGYYSAAEDEVAGGLLHAACQRLREQGCEFVLGPLDGSTWRRYRAAAEPSTRPLYFLEPDYTLQTHEQFLSAGFAEVARYRSALVEELLRCPAADSDVMRKFTASGGVCRTLDLENFEAEMRRIYDLTIQAFRSSPYFTTIAYTDFRALYGVLKNHLTPELFLLAERNGELLGFLFALRDYSQVARGEAIDTLVIKSLAVAPQASGQGLGSLLTAECHRRASQAGYRRAIHATMHIQNHSTRISQHSAQPFRTYALLGKALAGGNP